MSDSGKDRWNSLLETLGVPAGETASPPPSEAPPEETVAAPTKQQPISMLRPEKSKAAAKPKAAKPAPKSPSYWSRIAGVLGLESASESEATAEPAEQPVLEAPVIEPQEEPSFTRREETRRSSRPSREEESPRGFDRPRREDVRREESRRQEHRREEPRREEPRREEPRREAREEPTESSRQSLSEMFGKKEPDMNVFGLGLRDEDGETRTDVPEELPRGQVDSGAVLDYDRPEGSDLSFEQAAASERGFGDEEGEEHEGRRRRRRRGRGRGRGRGGERPAHAAERHESDIEPAGEDADFDIDRDEELDLDVEISDRSVSQERGSRSGEKPRDFEADEFAPRSERQPRRSEERRSEERGEGDRDEDRRGGRSRRGRTERSESGRRERDESRPPRGQRHAQRPKSPADDEPDEDLQAVGMDDDDSGDGGSPSHKKIPTWEEAVNLLIDANMASRANSPDRGDRGRGRGRGRGR
jgi:ribonuclease E